MKHIICIDHSSNLTTFKLGELGDNNSNDIILKSNLVILIDDDMQCINILKDRFGYSVLNTTDVYKQINHVIPPEENILII